MTSEWPIPPDGLLQSDREILSDSDLARVKATGMGLPDKLKLGVTRITHKNDPPEASDWVFLDETMRSDLATRLKAATRITDVEFVPAWMSADADVPHLREIAARFGVDLLLVFKTTCTVQKLGAHDPIVGTCAAEAVLLDARTGLVVGSWTGNGDHAADAPPLNVDPAPEQDGVVQRAAHDAVSKAADAVAQALNSMP
jgi:hypothetical protein